MKMRIFQQQNWGVDTVRLIDEMAMFSQNWMACTRVSRRFFFKPTTFHQIHVLGSQIFLLRLMLRVNNPKDERSSIAQSTISCLKCGQYQVMWREELIHDFSLISSDFYIHFYPLHRSEEHVSESVWHFRENGCGIFISTQEYTPSLVIWGW